MIHDVSARSQSLARLHKAGTLISLLCSIRKVQRAREQRRTCGVVKPRPPRIPPVTWEEFKAKPLFQRRPEEMFKRMFRMREETFDDIAARLDEHYDATVRRSSAGKILGAPRVGETKVRLAATLRYLGGGARVDICMHFNLLPSSLDGILKATLEDLYYTLPDMPLRAALDARETDESVLQDIAAGFSRASNGWITGCLGAIDGILMPIRSQRGKSNARCYYCRKGFHAMNVQAIADSAGRFLYGCIGYMPGAVHDSYAWSADSLAKEMADAASPLAKWLLARRYHLIGDDAYACTHLMATPWPGHFGPNDPKLAYNFVHSSARMSVERAFGMLCRKWLLLKRTYEGSMRRTWNSAGYHVTVKVCFLLHNLTIETGDEREARVYGRDLTGEVEARAVPPRPDHLGRVRPLDGSAVNVSSSNPDLAQAEKAAGDKSAAASAAATAWFDDDDDRSQRSAEYAKALKGAVTCASRLRATHLMGKKGVVRGTAVHWK